MHAIRRHDDVGAYALAGGQCNRGVLGILCMPEWLARVNPAFRQPDGLAHIIHDRTRQLDVHGRAGAVLLRGYAPQALVQIHAMRVPQRGAEPLLVGAVVHEHALVQRLGRHEVDALGPDQARGRRVETPYLEQAARVGRDGDGGADLVLEARPFVNGHQVARTPQGDGGREAGDAGPYYYYVAVVHENYASPEGCDAARLGKEDRD
jgi:hypothetical protein